MLWHGRSPLILNSRVAGLLKWTEHVSRQPTGPWPLSRHSKLQPQSLRRINFPRPYSSTSSNPTVPQPSSQGPEYEWIDDAEPLYMYSRGGFHPIVVGDLLDERYRIVDKLGFGGYSTVWLARDTQSETYVALKVCIADASECGRDPSDEVDILRALSNSDSSGGRHPGRGLVQNVLDVFRVTGPNGTHTCYTTPPALGNLRDIAGYRLFTLEMARALSAGLTLALGYVHSRGYVHGDIHLGNVLIAPPDPTALNGLSQSELYDKHTTGGAPEPIPIVRFRGAHGPLPACIPPVAFVPTHLYPTTTTASQLRLSDARRLVLSDFGEAFYSPSPGTHVRRCADSHTPLAGRPPESRFAPSSPLSSSSDIWSLATAIWDLIGAQPLFLTAFADVEDLTVQHVDVLGRMPDAWWETWATRGAHFAEDGTPAESRPLGSVQWSSLEEAFDEGVQRGRRKDGMGEFGADERRAVVDLVRRMLAYSPEERPSVEEVLESEWMVRWALPEFRREGLVPAVWQPPRSRQVVVYGGG